MKDYYKILGVDKKADKKEIKKRFRELSKQYHPDKKGGDEDKFKEIAEANTILSDDKKRREYDTRNQGFNPFGQRRPQPRTGAPLQMRIRITLEDVVKGLTKKLKYKRNIHCKTCDGSGGDSTVCSECNGSGVIMTETRSQFGHVIQQSTCHRCQGEGTVITNACDDCKGSGVELEDNEVSFDIPPGIPDNAALVYQNGGHYRKDGGAGDLILVITYAHHEKFEVYGNDLIYTLPLTYSELIQGGEHEVKSIFDTKLKFKVKELSNPNDSMRLKGKGLPDQYGHSGALIIVLKLKKMSKLTPEIKKILNKLEENLIE